MAKTIKSLFSPEVEKVNASGNTTPSHVAEKLLKNKKKEGTTTNRTMKLLR